jgi:hypothetical protein
MRRAVVVKNEPRRHDAGKTGRFSTGFPSWNAVFLEKAGFAK